MDLCTAAKDGDLERVRQLLDAKADIDQQDIEGSTPLHQACRYSHLEVARLLIESKANLELRRKVGSTPLMMCSNGKLTQLMLDSRADVLATRLDGCTALSFATDHLDGECARLLIAAKADINSRSAPADTDVKYVKPILHACEEGNEVVVRLLLEAKANANERFLTYTPLFSAAGNGFPNVVRVLLEAQADPDLRTSHNKTALQFGAFWSKVDACRALLEGKANPNVIDSTEPLLGVPQASVMLLALQRDAAPDDPTLFELLMQYGADPSYVNDDGIGALLLAAYSNKPSIVRALLDGKANLHQRMTSNQATALTAACEEGHLHVLRILLEYQADVNQVNKSNYTSLMSACTEGRSQLVAPLVEARADPNHVSEVYNETPLVCACACSGDSPECVQALLDAKALPDLPCTQAKQKTGLFMAASCGHLSQVKTLLAAGASPNHRTFAGSAPLHAAAKDKHLEVMRALLDAQADVEAVDGESGSVSIPTATPLILAAEAAHLDGIQLLLEYRANPNHFTKNGTSALLTIAFCGGPIVAMELLLAAKADIDTQMTVGFTPLFAACEAGMVEHARWLLLSGANLDHTTTDGRSNLYAACENNRLECAELLLSFGANELLGLSPLAVAQGMKYSDIVALFEPQRLAAIRQSMVWSFGTHRFAPPDFRHLVYTVMLCYTFDDHSLLALLPRELLWLLFIELCHLWPRPKSKPATPTPAAMPPPPSTPAPPPPAAVTRTATATATHSNSRSPAKTRRKDKCLIA